MPPAAHPIKYTVEIANVRELSLIGAADYDYWAAHLAGTGLLPQRVNRQAELSLGATDLTWAGVRFNESILALTVVRAPTQLPIGGLRLGQAAAPDTPAGLYLLHAYNSNRALAFMERTFFRTPYYPAAIQLVDQAPARFEVRDPAGGLLRAEAGRGTRAVRATNEVWEGPIHLPRRRAAPQGLGGYFYAKLGGPGEAYAFTSADTLTLTPSAASPVLQWLRDSRFTPQEWRRRPAAQHGKSATFRQPPA